MAQIHVCTVRLGPAIDYKATYIYGIGNGRALPIVLHWAALKHSPEYLALAKINWKVTFWSHSSSLCTSCQVIYGENEGQWYSWEAVMSPGQFCRAHRPAFIQLAVFLLTNVYNHQLTYPMLWRALYRIAHAHYQTVTTWLVSILYKSLCTWVWFIK